MSEGTYAPPKATVPKGIQERAAAADQKLEAMQGATPAEQPTSAPRPAPEKPASPTAGEPAPIPGARPGETAEETIRRQDQALKVLQGKYNAEVPRLMAENADLKKRIGDPVDRPAVEVNDRHREMADKWGVEAEDIASLESGIIEKIQGTPAKTPIERETYLETLDNLIGGSEQRMAVVNDPAFNEFLNLPDAGTGQRIRDIATEADSVNDSATMADVYRAFQAFKKTPAARSSHLMPSGKGAPGPGDLRTDKKPIYSQADVDNFNHKVRAGYFRTIGMNAEDAKQRKAEHDRWSNALAEAKAEGRIRN
jgi:hypothetical protein